MSNEKAREARYGLDGEGRYVIERYPDSPAFASFLPGIAGPGGIPMWAFYVNRGQGVASFGVDTKDDAILEFFSANRSYELTPTNGFRTFIKLDGAVYEPFSRAALAEGAEQTMEISSWGLSLRDRNEARGIETSVEYFTLPGESLAALVRRVKVSAIGKGPIRCSILDGLPQIAPTGLNHFLLKNLTNLTQAWTAIEWPGKNLPFYKLKLEVSDTTETRFVEKGNFFFSVADGARKPAPILVDPALAFGRDEARLRPEAFAAAGFAVPAAQRAFNLVCSGFAHHEAAIEPGAPFSFASYCGQARDAALYLDFAARAARTRDYAAWKSEENRELVEWVMDQSLTLSADPRLDAYARQNYLDNVLRGGLPVEIGDTLFYLYSRKHGDLERDYNAFKIAPTYYSQGNGNYRDVCQNRRSDVVFNPFVGDAAVRTFMNLIQLDGYNPLVVEGARFHVADPKELVRLLVSCVRGAKGSLQTLLAAGFAPGELLGRVEAEGLELAVPPEEFVARALGCAVRVDSARHGEGYWSDHWHYNLDLIESFLSVYPDRARELFFGGRTYSFFESHARVLPRSEKYFATEHGLRQHKAVEEDEAKEAALGKRSDEPHAARTRRGEGEVYRTGLYAKLCVLAICKAALLDPAEAGIEFEANKPNWYDALNGLPGLLGSSSAESYELARLLRMLRGVPARLAMKEDRDFVPLPAEAADFLAELQRAFALPKPFERWDSRASARERYRERIKDGIEGTEREVRISALEDFFDAVLKRIEDAERRSIDRASGLPNTYFANEATKFRKTGRSRAGMELAEPSAFKQKPLALFLEGVVHAMRVEPDPEVVRAMHERVKKSALYDKKLGMYKVNAPLAKESYEIGRAKAFPAGWLENESIWLHMEYKYLLELARKGLWKEYHAAAERALVYNLDPATYGRSVLENSSFICSSAYYDPAERGRGFYARLSGSTAEFVHMWLLMCAGDSPFVVEASGELRLNLRPAVPGKLFTEEARTLKWRNRAGRRIEAEVPEGSFCFMFLGTYPVVYRNAARADSWKLPVGEILLLDSAGKVVERGQVKGEWAQRLRGLDPEICLIQVELG